MTGSRAWKRMAAPSWGALVAAILAPLLIAAWPDSLPSRRVAIAALQYDLVSEGIVYDAALVRAKYDAACKKGFVMTCDWEQWQGAQGGDLKLAGQYFSRRCSSEPAACVVSGWAKSRVGGVVSPEAPDPAGAAKDLRKGCVKDQLAPACTALGELYLAGVGVKADPAEGFTRIKEGCDAEDWWGCWKLGELYAAGQGTAQSMQDAASSYDIACSNGVPEGCGALAALKERGEGVAQDAAGAAELYGRACKEKHSNSCFALGQMYAEGRGVAASPAVALGLYQASCASGDLRGCYGLGTLYEEGRVVQADADQAVRHYDGACEAGFAPACSRLGHMYIAGKSLEKDRALGIRYLQRGCQAGDQAGCVGIGEMYETGRGVEADLARAVDLYTGACHAGESSGCQHLAALYEAGRGVTQNHARAKELYEQSCAAGDGAACGALARKFLAGDGVIKSTTTALRYLERACQGRHGESCASLGKMYADGSVGGQPDLAKSALMYRDACALGSAQGCAVLGGLYTEGKGIEQDFYLALRAYKSACDQGIQSACAASQPIQFQARFEGIVRSAFEPKGCQVWSFDAEDTDRIQLLVEARGDQLRLMQGKDKGSVAQLRHLRNEYEQSGKTRVARSFWGVTLDGRALEREIEHHEVWRTDRESVEAFPGEESFSLEPKGGASLIYSRETEEIRRPEGGRCRFQDDYAYLTSENCSEVQALAAASLLSSCR